MKKSNMVRFGALVVGLSFVAVSCGSSNNSASDTTAAAATTSGGDLEGMKGTIHSSTFRLNSKMALTLSGPQQATKHSLTTRTPQKHSTL